MEGVDKITLELLMNKAQYNKYLAIKDPNKYEEVQQHLEKVAKYRDRIMQITDEYCENQNKQNSIELDEAFSNYLKSCIRFIEMKELEAEPKYERDMEDAIFERCDNNTPMKSFWGKGAVKKNM
jgi:hypothetical protein